MAETSHARVGTGKPDRYVPTPNTCGGCDATWTGANQCHCSGCHRSFGGVGLFDRHRSTAGPHGTCIDPETITHRDTGERLMFLRGGLWREAEMTQEQKARAFGRGDAA